MDAQATSLWIVNKMVYNQRNPSEGAMFVKAPAGDRQLPNFYRRGIQTISPRYQLPE
jgi:hypothetical protein